MTVEGDAATVMAKAEEAVHDATEAVQTTSASIASAIEAGRRPGAFLDQLARLTRDAPLPALAMAVLVGVMIARRR
jgi:ABC-type transporter Mla maintaining outer membrane lipid asymmetry permease subunit MlaE